MKQALFLLSLALFTSCAGNQTRVLAGVGESVGSTSIFSESVHLQLNLDKGKDK